MNEVEEYSSDIFGNFRYEDLKKAHLESVIPVTEEDIDDRNIFNNLEQLNRDRNSQILTPLSLKQANKYLHDIKNNDEEINIHRAYNLALENENNSKKNNDFMKRLRVIK